MPCSADTPEVKLLREMLLVDTERLVLADVLVEATVTLELLVVFEVVENPDVFIVGVAPRVNFKILRAVLVVYLC